MAGVSLTSIRGNEQRATALLEALQAHGGNITRAAGELGTSRQLAWYHVYRLGLYPAVADLAAVAREERRRGREERRLEEARARRARPRPPRPPQGVTREQAMAALRQTGGNVRRAALSHGMCEVISYRWVRKFGLQDYVRSLREQRRSRFRLPPICDDGAA